MAKRQLLCKEQAPEKGKSKVKKINLSGYNLQTKIYWSIMLCLSSLALGYALFGLLSFTASQFLVLAVSLIVAVLVNQHQFRIPKTRLNLSARKILIFWGAIWLGVPGAVFLCLASSISKYQLSIRDKNHYLLGVYANILSSLAAAQVFYFSLKYLGGFGEMPVAGKAIGVEWLLGSAALMVITHYVSVSVLNAIFLKLESDYPILSLWKDNYLPTLLSYCISFAGALVLHYSLLQFGLAFGLVIFPVTLVGHIAFRIHFKRLAQKTREITEASRIHLATVEALATAIDARDQVGVGHVRRTQIFAVGLGEILNLSPDEIHALHTGALLHDIGKLAVPDHILNKPGRLTNAEMEKMKIHSTVGASILEKVNFPYPVVPTVKHHHEWWNGTGYPNGLKDEQIPLTARILSIADAYDALRGARPFREAVSREEARKFLVNGAGTQFDPRLVDIFLRNLKKFEAEVEASCLFYNFEDEEEEFSGAAEANTGNFDDQGFVAQIKRANREVFALYELARVFSSALTLQETLSLFVKKISELVPFDTCVVYLFDKTEEYAVALYPEGKNAVHLKNRKVKPGEGATGYVLKTRQSVFNINPALDFSFYQMDFIQDYRSMASLPLITEEKLIGAVSLYSCELENYEDEHMRLLEMVSKIAADAVSKSLYHAETESRALTDPMTGFPNARSLQIQFEKEAARADRSGLEFQLLMLDLDGFKAINDTYGHKAGDTLLKEVARVMRAQLRDYDFLARYAGDEFVIIVPETCEEAIKELCERIEKAVLDFKLPVGGGKFAQVGVSLGAACYPKAGDTLDQVIIAADKAMYSVKAAHRQKRNSAHTQPEMPNQILKAAEDSIIVELDESHIISSAIN
jgi:diguanylate cyclase (GGDEF)-like protein/putative nucleotidyltransferase with HDIG domain